MSQDRLGPITRALVGVDRSYLGTVADIINRLNSADAARWDEHFKDDLRKGLPPLEPPPPLLVFDEKHVAEIALVHPHDPATFWQDTREAPARYVWPGFTNGVVARALPIEETGIVKVPYADAARDTTVRGIMDAPGTGDHDPSHLSKLIASMISAQPNGEYTEHGLLNDGRANLFPCGSLLVYVHWLGVHRYWRVLDWGPDHGVDAGRRVFSGNLKL